MICICGRQQYTSWHYLLLLVPPEEPLIPANQGKHLSHSTNSISHLIHIIFEKKMEARILELIYWSKTSGVCAYGHCMLK